MQVQLVGGTVDHKVGAVVGDNVGTVGAGVGKSAVGIGVVTAQCSWMCLIPLALVDDACSCLMLVDAG